MSESSNRLLGVTTIFLAIIMLSGIFVSLSVLNQYQIAGAQQQKPNANLTSTEKQHLLDGVSFQINNVTFTHHTDTVNGIRMHYVIGGHGDLVVLLHGWPETWYAWRHVMPALAKNYTVIVPDLRGLGDSSKPTTGYDGRTVAEDIHQLVTKLGFKTIFLVGHDIGTQVAYSYAAGHPTEVKKLAVMELTIPGFAPPGRMPIWWGIFHQVPDVPEALVQGKEMIYLIYGMKILAQNVTGITVPNSGHFIPEEQPQFLSDQLLKFFGNK